jgi:serine/threonine-protein kinase HipA
MARAATYAPLKVYLNQRLVGTLSRHISGAIGFQYATAWLHWRHTFPVSLSLPLREDRYTGNPVTAVFENLLPDNQDIRHTLAERVHAKGDDAYSLLAAIGRDCVGALQFIPEKAPSPTPDEIRGQALTPARVGKILAGLGKAPLGLGSDEQFRISIAGAQEKTALLRWQDKWNLPYGSTPTTHILKPQIGVLRNGIDLSESVENEHLCMRLAAALDLPVANTSIGNFGATRALVVERFDRQWTRENRLLRVPQEDCCQALAVPPVRKYESEGGPGIRDILQLLKASDAPAEDQRTFMKAQIVFWLLGATDGHAKNFSIFLHPGGGFRLTPLYDIVSLQPAADAGRLRHRQMRFAMAVGDKRHYILSTIMPRHFAESGVAAGMRAQDIESIFVEIRNTAPDALAAVRKQLGKKIPKALSASIIGGFEKRLGLLSLDTGALPRASRTR